MRIFVTGASGWIGSALVPKLLKAGHEVTGLARTDGAAAKLDASGVHVLRGDLDDVETLQTGARSSDAVIHLAYKHAAAFTPDGFAQAAAACSTGIRRASNAQRAIGRPMRFCCFAAS